METVPKLNKRRKINEINNIFVSSKGGRGLRVGTHDHSNPDGIHDLSSVGGILF